MWPHPPDIPFPEVVSDRHGMRTTLAFLGFALVCANALPREPICACTLEYAPVCGSDGVTYPNRCALKCKAKADSELKEISEGPCVQSLQADPNCVCTMEYRPVCGNDGVTYGNPCMLNCKRRVNLDLKPLHYGPCEERAEAKHHCVCPKNLKPACGSDGVTYSNPCVLKCAESIKPGLFMEHMGRCGESFEQEPFCPCNRMLLPVCGSDGKTYNNPCLLNCQTKRTPSLKMVHYGPCVQEQEQNFCPCNKMLLPVCGSDGKTYNNPCLLNCQKRQDKDLELVRYGPCLQKMESKRVCPCNRMYLPVCGSDGQTYNNPCLLACQQKDNTDLKMVHYGACAEQLESKGVCPCNRMYLPVCGSDGQTYNNPCLLACQQKDNTDLKMVHYGGCAEQLEGKSVCRCNRMYLPVCGSDGQTYNNPCLLACQKKDNADLKMVHYGACAEQLEGKRVCPCNRMYLPVCGSDGQTYNNPCLLACQQKDNTDLKMVHYGACAEQLESKRVCPCNRMYLPICGSDGQTYNNPCLLACQQKDNADLKMVHYGACAEQLEGKRVCPCNRMYLPVCGSDGQTYNNPCLLACQQKDNSDLSIARYGRCEDEQLEQIKPCACPFNYMPVCGTDGVTYPNECGLKCVQKQTTGLQISHEGPCTPKSPVCPCPRNLSPVCGSDGVTYNNQCLLDCQAKVSDGLIKVYEGPCATPYSLVDSPICPCPKIYSPVCGTDGTTYANQCLLNCKARQTEGLEVAQEGPCPSFFKTEAACKCHDGYKPVCGTDGWTYPNECALNCLAKTTNGNLKLDHRGFCFLFREIKKNPCVCTMDWRPVCGTDGKTYGNMCGLRCAQNENSELQMAYEGECSTVAFKRPPCMCTREYAPVCGTDGKTYGNKCTLECAQQGNSEIQMAYEGQCTTLAFKRPPCMCTREYAPVCGSDGKTYGNKCMLECAQEGNSELQMAYEGECSTVAFKRPPCMCTREYAPVCGTDGKTYGNNCMLECAQQGNSDLAAAYEGQCTTFAYKRPPCVCTKEYEPVCGTDGKTYGNKCMFKCELLRNPALRIFAEGECNKPFKGQPCACPDNYRPVCGSDGKTYPNMCEFQCNARVNHDLSLRGVGEC